MADRNIVTFEEERNEHGPHWTLHIDRSASGRPGLFFTVKTEMHSEADKHIASLNQEMTVVVKDGMALIAPVLAWLLDPSDDLFDEVVQEAYRRQFIGDDSAPSWESLRAHRRAEWDRDIRDTLDALIAVGQKRLNEQFRVGGS